MRENIIILAKKYTHHHVKFIHEGRNITRALTGSIKSAEVQSINTRGQHKNVSNKQKARELSKFTTGYCSFKINILKLVNNLF